MLIADGAITINSADDSVHSNDTIAISGGTIAINDEDRNCGFIGGLAA